MVPPRLMFMRVVEIIAVSLAPLVSYHRPITRVLSQPKNRNTSDAEQAGA